MDQEHPKTEVIVPKARKSWPRPKHPRKVTPAVVDQVAVLAAGGVSTRDAAKALKLAPGTITAIKSREEVQALIVRLRETIRELSLTEIAKGQQRAWDWLGEIVDLKDSKSFDLVTRGLAALEKISSSTSGEARRVEGVVIHEHTDNRNEARELLHRLLAVDAEIVPEANKQKKLD